jgi:hypothetical protein
LGVDEELNYNEKLSGADGYERQARGALKIAKRIVDKLHEMGIYDSSEIVIMSDHGTLSVPPRNRQANFSILHDIPEKVQSSSLALLLHKEPFASGEMVVDDSPLYHYDLACLLRAANDNIDCSSFEAAINTKNRKRRYLFYDWKHEYWKRDFMPAMTEYFVDGHAYKASAWQEGNYIFEPGRKIKKRSLFISSKHQFSFQRMDFPRILYVVAGVVRNPITVGQLVHNRA